MSYRYTDWTLLLTVCAIESSQLTRTLGVCRKIIAATSVSPHPWMFRTVGTIQFNMFFFSFFLFAINSVHGTAVGILLKFSGGSLSALALVHSVFPAFMLIYTPLGGSWFASARYFMCVCCFSFFCVQSIYLSQLNIARIA